MQTLMALVAGFIFGVGLVVSGLANPAKVLNFLDVAGAWDPSLALTMASAVVTTAVGYRLAFYRSRPVFSKVFDVPSGTQIDGRLLSGAAMFGLGWGLVGYCPGPAIVALSIGESGTIIFIMARLIGMGMGRIAPSFSRSGVAKNRPVSKPVSEAIQS